jgi:hypothetical protein
LLPGAKRVLETPKTKLKRKAKVTEKDLGIGITEEETLDSV